MIFKNREDAGRQLAEQLAQYTNLEDVLVLGIPRGGVRVAFEIAKALHIPLDVFLSRKLGVPGQEELAFGAIAAGDGRFLDREIIEDLGVSEAQIERITQATKQQLDERARLYRGGQPLLQIAGRQVILVDDGIATGASIYAAIHALRRMEPKKLIIAAPVAPLSTISWLRSITDELIVLYTPKNFYAVGQFYESFPQTSDEEVMELLNLAIRFLALRSPRKERTESVSPTASMPPIDQRAVFVTAGTVALEGTLDIPAEPKGIVVFAHGSGSSRHSPRNRYVAEFLQKNGFATLLFDLLTREEDILDQRTTEFRFNISLLAARLIHVTDWIARSPETANLPIGYFGASTGAAAALIAANQLPDIVGAIVCRGGRPDLADDLEGGRAPTLLIVGGLDEMVLSFNRQALGKLTCQHKQLVVVPGATHLFEEPSTIEQVARLAADWFSRHLGEKTQDTEHNVLRVADRR